VRKQKAETVQLDTVG